MEDLLSKIRARAIQAAAGVVVIINATSTAASFMGLRAWAQGHELVGAGGYLFPLFIDTFPLLAEVALFVGLLDGWRFRAKAVPWSVITAGVILSVALQVGVSTSPDWATRATHGLAPVAAWLSLVVGTVMFELIMKNARPAIAEETPEVEAVDAVTEPIPVVPDEEEQQVPDTGLVPRPVLLAAAEEFKDDLVRGHVPGVLRIRKSMHVGHTKAPHIQDYLRGLATPLDVMSYKR